jgi:hypothetical protein
LAGYEPIGLYAVKAGPNLINLSELQTWISVRDHMTRVRLIAHQLEELGYLVQGKKVLVAGGGVAGVSFAMFAAARGVHVTLAEQGPDLFAAQLNCRTRYLHLLEYDWPRPSYKLNMFPRDVQQSLGISWSPRASTDYLETVGTGTAEAHALDWIRQLTNFVSSSGQLQTRLNTKLVTTYWSSSAQEHIALLTDSSSSPHQSFYEQFHLIVLATGQSKERTSWTVTAGSPGFFAPISQPFWENDNLPNFIWNPTLGNLLIFGLGDGALQDLWRAVVQPTLTTAREILTCVEQALRGRWAPNWEVPLWQAEEQAVRAYAQLRVTLSVEAVWKALDDAYAKTVSSLSQQDVSVLAQALLRSQPPQAIVLVARNAVPGRVYGLNRFIYHLLLKVLPAGSVHVVKDLEATLAQSGSGFQLTFSTGAQLVFPLSGALPNVPTDFQKVVIRTGPANNPQPATGSIEALRQDIARAPQPFVSPV